MSKRTVHRLGRWLATLGTVLFLASLMSGGCASNRCATKESNMQRGASLNMKTLLAGRFAMQVPADWNVNEEMVVSTQYVKVSEVPMEGTDEDRFDRLWQARVAKRRESFEESLDLGGSEEMLDSPPPTRVHVLREAAKYSDGIPPEFLVMTPMNSWAVAAEVGLLGRTERPPYDDAYVVHRALTVLSSYRARTPGEPVDPLGLYLRHGYVHAPLQEGEYATFAVGPGDDNHWTSFRYEIKDWHHQTKRLSGGLAQAIVEGIAAWGSDIDEIRSGSRTVAGLKGEEIIVREGTRLNYEWLLPASGKGTMEIDISRTASTRELTEREATQAWDDFLCGLVYLPKEGEGK